MLKNMKIGLRLGFGFGLVLILMVAIIIIAINSMAHIEDKLNRIVKVNNVRQQLANDMNSETKEVSIDIRTLLLTPDIGKRQEQKKKIEELRAGYDGAFKKLEELTPKDDKEGHEIIAKVKAAQEATVSPQNRVIELAFANKTTEAIDLLNKPSSCINFAK